MRKGSDARGWGGSVYETDENPQRDRKDSASLFDGRDERNLC